MPAWGRPLILKYSVDEHDLLNRVEGPWNAFAAENDAPHLEAQLLLGQSLWDHVSGMDTRHMYQQLLARVRSKRTAVRFNFRCDAPDTQRLLEMEVSSADGSEVRFCATLLEEHPRNPAIPVYAPETGEPAPYLYTMCSVCKKLQSGEEWLELEAGMKRFHLLQGDTHFDISHGLCGDCSRKLANLIDAAN